MQRAGTRVQIQLTGQVTVFSEGGELGEADLPGRQGRLVLAALAIAGEPVHREVLAETLWPEQLPATWERTLSGVVSRLRSAFVKAGFEDLAIANAFGCYELQMPAEAEIDVRAAAASAAEGERLLAVGDLLGARTAADQAVAVARQPLLAGEDATWLSAEREELKNVLVRSLDVLAASTLGDSASIDRANEAIAIDPFRESSHVLLMRAHVALGNPAEALLAYERCRTLLADELGIDPSPETQALHVALLRSDGDALIDSLASSGLLTLPQTATSFVGRTTELAAVLDLFARARLVTLVGPGGVGKTRLAIEAARSVTATFPDGVHFVDLTSLSTTSPIAPTLAAVLGLRGPTTPDGIAAVLGSQKVLLLLDNCEHVLDQVTGLVDVLLDRTDVVTVLATSREPLACAGEARFDVPPLECPHEETDDVGVLTRSDAVALFVERASAVRRGFGLTPANVEGIAQICRRLDGIPLAIELVASRIANHGIAELAERIDERLDPASAGRLPRHRTVEAAIDWSYDLLNRGQADTFRLVSVFEGSFTPEDAAAVCARDPTADVAGLIERSLLSPEGSSDRARLRMLETIKTYARERAAATDGWEDARDRHSRHFTDAVSAIDRADDPQKLMRFDAIRSDAAVALERAFERAALEDVLTLSEALAGFWAMRGLLAEGRSALDRAIALARSHDRIARVPSLLRALGTIVEWTGDVDEATRITEEAIRLAEDVGDETTLSALLADRASLEYQADRLDGAVAAAVEAIATSDRCGNDSAAGQAAVVLSVLASTREDGDECRRYAQEALERFERIGHVPGMTRALGALSMAADSEDEKRTILDRALVLSRESGDQLTEGMLLEHIGDSLFQSGCLPEALEYLKLALRMTRRTGNRVSALGCIEEIGCIEALAGDPVAGLRLIACARTQRDAISSGPWHTDMALFDAALTRAKADAGALADEAWSAGVSIGFEEACAAAGSVTLELAPRA